MDEMKLLCRQIIAAANAVEVAGEENMAQLMGICRSARRLYQLAQRQDKDVGEGEDDG